MGGADDQTLQERLAAMTLALEASRAEVRAARQQSRDKTIALNETLIQTQRRLAAVRLPRPRRRARPRAGAQRRVSGDPDPARGPFAAFRPDRFAPSAVARVSRR